MSAAAAPDRSGFGRGRRLRPLLKVLAPLLGALALLPAAGCGSGAGEGEPIRISVPRGAAFSHVADSLAARQIVSSSFLFGLYARLEGATGSIKPGGYEFRRGQAWSSILEALREGRVITLRLVIPEAWDIMRIGPRIASVLGLTPDSVLAILADTSAPARYGVPGPTLEGYLYPATYSFDLGTPLDVMLRTMVANYQRVWTPARRARADSLGLSEREIITLASIVEKEARHLDELPIIAAVYHNRLRIGIPLQADPTVQYALGRQRARLLYAHIDSVADSPYNTYRIRGLPPGPIGSPSERGIEATLYPANVRYLYFVARPDGSHVFSNSLLEHNRAKLAIRRELRTAADSARANPRGRPTTR